MIINKESVSKHFSKASKSYDAQASFQAYMAQELIKMLNSKEYKNILEIGCGTGYLSSLLLDKFNPDSLLLNDLSENMLTLCKEKFKHNDKVSFLLKDAESLSFSDKNLYSLIISNACFQWLKDLEEALMNYKSALSKNGILAFTTFGKSNFKELKAVSGLGLDYLDKQRLESILCSIGSKYKFEEIEAKTHYKDALSMLKSLKATGVSGLSKSVWTRQKLQSFISDYQRQYTDNLGCYLTWNVFYVVASF
jgi:malonyl-CoA O-methyltransferase